MIACMSAKQKMPTPAQLEQFALQRPWVINALVAYFVMEWRTVTLKNFRGEDAHGNKRKIPNYMADWGVDGCLDALHRSPRERGPHDPGGLTVWLETV